MSRPIDPRRIAWTPARLAAGLLGLLAVEAGVLWAGWVAPRHQAWQAAEETAQTARRTLAQRSAWQALLARPGLRQAASGLGCDLSAVHALAGELDLDLLLGKTEPRREIGAWNEAEAGMLLSGRFSDLARFAMRLNGLRPVTRLYVTALVRADARRLDLHGVLRCLQPPVAPT